MALVFAKLFEVCLAYPQVFDRLSTLYPHSKIDFVVVFSPKIENGLTAYNIYYLLDSGTEPPTLSPKKKDFFLLVIALGLHCITPLISLPKPRDRPVYMSS